MDSLIVKGVWYEVEITECKTYVIFRDRAGEEIKFYNDEEGAKDLSAFIQDAAADIT